MSAGGGVCRVWNGIGDGESSDLRRLDLLSFLLSFAISTNDRGRKEASGEGYLS